LWYFPIATQLEIVISETTFGHHMKPTGDAKLVSLEGYFLSHPMNYGLPGVLGNILRRKNNVGSQEM
jgi:hypothetical protein